MRKKKQTKTAIEIANEQRAHAEKLETYLQNLNDARSNPISVSPASNDKFHRLNKRIDRAEKLFPSLKQAINTNDLDQLDDVFHDLLWILDSLRCFNEFHQVGRINVKTYAESIMLPLMESINADGSIHGMSERYAAKSESILENLKTDLRMYGLSEIEQSKGDSDPFYEFLKTMGS